MSAECGKCGADLYQRLKETDHTEMEFYCPICELKEELSRERAENKALKDMLREIEDCMWDYARGGIRECFICKGKFMFGGHVSNCRLAALLKED